MPAISFSLIMCAYYSKLSLLFRFPFINTGLDWDLHVYYCIIHFSRIEKYNFAFWWQSRMLLQGSFSKSVASHVTICLLWQGGGIPGREWRRSCLSSVAELILKTEGAICHPLRLRYKTWSPSVLKFLNKSHPPPPLPLHWEGIEFPVNAC